MPLFSSLAAILIAGLAPSAAAVSADDVLVARDVAYSRDTAAKGPSPTRLLDIYCTAGAGRAGNRPALIAIHGGSLTGGDKSETKMAELCREMARRGHICFSINYRLRDAGATSEHAFDRAVGDAARALAWVHRNAARLRVDRNRIFVGGSSAGAAIALHLAYHPEHPGERLASIAGILSWSGAFYAPLGLIRSGPPLFIVHGEEDETVNVAEARRLAARMAELRILHAAIYCAGLGHNVPFDRRPLGSSLYDHLADFLRRAGARAHGAKPNSTPIPAGDAAIPCPR
jgi:acetyl esterase/lipase